ncbi:hypothetical protein GCM10027285_01190 [Oleiagrimonas citrea]|uniref:Cell division protein FtsI n=1 Tax=Oleiagrimonas citrea TaxID=1665687 RepID=A0A846ZQM1_9GAMM|nr:Sbal_3080 family lipoprotein [Oleiagrimonas citrea]NKZ39870.1 hypothetical protein [Oleiagrimonas citrea]
MRLVTSLLLLSFTGLMLASCTSVQVRPLVTKDKVDLICIQRNPAVKVDDFVMVLQRHIDAHGIASRVFDGTKPDDCHYVLTYTARRSWDFSPYLSVAHLWLQKDGRGVASSDYHLRGKGGLALTKWQGTEAKIGPVIDKLLAGQN